MAALIVFPHGPASTDARPTPLDQSLRGQTVDAWRLAHGPAIGLEHDDIAMHLPTGVRLHGRACEWILRTLAEHPEAAALYGDRLVGGKRQARPAWSPTRAQSEPGATLPLAVRASRPEFDPHADPWDLERRMADSQAAVVHLPSVLTIHPAPVGEPVAPWPDDPRFEPGPRPGTRRRRPSPLGQSSVSIVIPSAGFSLPGATRSMLARCLEALGLLDPPPAEVILVIGDEFQGQIPNGGWGTDPRVVHRGRGPFDFSRAVNCGLLASRGELVLLLNDDTEAEATDWLGRMAAHLEVPTIGAVGATLLYPDRTVQHTGVVIDDARPLHPFVGQAPTDTAAHGGDVARDVIGVTGACLLARRRDLLAVGGMPPELPLQFGDIDLCLRLRRSGLRVVLEPAAVLVHHESKSREPSVEPWEWDRFIHRWGEVVDPWYHPAFWRPDDPDRLNRNADHLDPLDRNGEWPARDTRIRSRVYRSRLQLPEHPADTVSA